MDGIPHLSAAGYLLRFGEALGLGIAIGLEREWRQRSAGLHTTALVAAGASLFTMITSLIDTPGDTTRIAAQVVSGIGFLAGGVILRQGATVRGLTTAATIWATAAVGVLAGYGLFLPAAIAGVAIVLTNLALYPAAQLIGKMKRTNADVRTVYLLQIICSRDAEAVVREDVLEAVSESQMTLRSMRSSPAGNAVEVRAELALEGRNDRAIELVSRIIRERAGTLDTHWEATEELM